jgi:hypothetical protein
MIFSPGPKKEYFFLSVFLTFCSIFTMPCIGYAQEGGYVSKLSVTKGDMESFFLSSRKDSLDLQIFRLGLQKTLVQTLHHLKAGIQDIPDSVYTKGCGWLPTAKIMIPSDWLPGVYEADFPTSYGIGRVEFVVKEKQPGTYAKVVVCLTVNTYEAYNNWGGKSLYDFNSTNKKQAFKVSFDRPFTNDSTYDFFRWTNKLVRWLDKENIPVEYCTNLDLDGDPKFLSNYTVYVTVGHDEYWSKPERTECENFMKKGGRIIVLSGNTCWWQVRLEDSLHTLVCYRDFHFDPLFHKQDSIVTCNWRRFPVNDSENSLIGVSFEQGGYVNNGNTLTHKNGYGGFTVYNSWHWIFNHTGLIDGDIIGYQPAVVGYETDGTYFKWADGLPIVTGYGKTPLNYSLLGISPASTPDGLYPGHTTMGYYTNRNNGALFNVATTNWVEGLIVHPDSAIIQITRNIFDRFTNTKPLPPEIYLYSPAIVTQDSINQELVSIGRRSLPLRYDKADTFIVHAREPVGRPLHYIWMIEGNILGEDSVLILHPAEKRFFPSGITLKAFVISGDDTVTLEWALFNTDVYFVSIPPDSSFSSHSVFQYKPEALSRKNRHLRYEIVSAPDWLGIDSNSVVHGIINALPGIYDVRIRATDSVANQDIQTFQITVKNMTSSIKPYTSDQLLLTAHPNPFSSAVQIEFDLKQDIERATLEIASTTGTRICTLIQDTALIQGKHLVFWDGIDNAGRYVSEGMYYCRFLVHTSSGQDEKALLKLVRKF